MYNDLQNLVHARCKRSKAITIEGPIAPTNATPVVQIKKPFRVTRSALRALGESLININDRSSIIYIHHCLLGYPIRAKCFPCLLFCAPPAHFLLQTWPAAPVVPHCPPVSVAPVRVRRTQLDRKAAECLRCNHWSRLNPDDSDTNVYKLIHITMEKDDGASVACLPVRYQVHYWSEDGWSEGAVPVVGTHMKACDIPARSSCCST